MQLFETPENRLPPGAIVHRVKTLDGVALRALTAPGTASSVPRGTVVVLNGRGDFIERYFETMRDLQGRGFHVAGLDWRGQGGSERLLKDRSRGHIRSYRQYDEDLRAFMEGVVLKNCPGPYYALAHSTGGHILLRNLLHRRWFAKAIVTAPLLGLNFGNWSPSLAYLLSSMALAVGIGSAFLPGFKKGPVLFETFEGNPLSSDEKRWARDLHTMHERPELAVGGPTYSWLNATIRSLRELHGRKYRGGLACPVMVVLAGKERVVDNKAAHRFIESVPGVSHVTINSSLHEILLETDVVRSQCLAVVDSYFSP